jgi:hypothetical protein
MMTYAMKPLGCDPARIKGMSERMIVSHYENNYGGAVKRLNLIDQRPQARGADRHELDDPARAVLRRPRRPG